MRAWQAGLVVVASAGNRGPDAMTVGVPGNVPYVITAGAMTDSYTPEVVTDDQLASFSSAGSYRRRVRQARYRCARRSHSSHDGQVVRPGTGITEIFRQKGLLHHVGDLAVDRAREWHRRIDASARSTRSRSDDVKCRLMASARPAVADERGPRIQHLPARCRDGERLRRCL